VLQKNFHWRFSKRDYYWLVSLLLDNLLMESFLLQYSDYFLIALFVMQHNSSNILVNTVKLRIP
jgi:hypothetical protein